VPRGGQRSSENRLRPRVLCGLWRLFATADWGGAAGRPSTESGWPAPCLCIMLFFDPAVQVVDPVHDPAPHPEAVRADTQVPPVSQRGHRGPEDIRSFAQCEQLVVHRCLCGACLLHGQARVPSGIRIQTWQHALTERPRVRLMPYPAASSTVINGLSMTFLLRCQRPLCCRGAELPRASGLLPQASGRRCVSLLRRRGWRLDRAEGLRWR